MFCPNCGGNVPEGAKVCTYCGNPLEQPQQPQYQQPQYQAPQYQQPQYQEPQYQQPQYQAPQYQQPQYQAPQYQQTQSAPVTEAPDTMTRREFISSSSSKAVKKNASLVIITMILSLAILAGGIYAALSMPFYDIPVLGAVLNLADADPSDLTDELSRELGYIQAQYEFSQAVMGETEQEAVEALMEKAEALVDNFSILNFKAYMGVVEEYSDKLGYSTEIEGFDEAEAILNAAVGVLVGFFFLPLLFTLLGGLLKSTGLTVTALIFTAISQALFCGGLWVLAGAVVYIVQAVLCSKITKAYRSYRLGLAPL